MPTYRITWKIDEEADTIEEAVCQAWEAMRGADSEATCFEVIDHATNQGVFDDFYDVVHNTEGGSMPVRRELDERPIHEQLGFDSVWAEHPVYDHSSWIYEASIRTTVLSYWDWVKNQLDSEDKEDDPADE